MTGGSRRSATSGLLSQEAQIEQHKQNLERLLKNLDSLRKQREDRARDLELYDETLEKLNARISELRIEITLNEDKSKQSVEIIETLTKEISMQAGEYEIVKERIKELGEKLSSIDELEAIVKSRGEEYDSLVSMQKTESGERKSERDQLSEEVMNLRIKITQTKSDLDSFDSEMFRH